MHIDSVVRQTLGLKGHRVEKVNPAGGAILVRLAADKRSRPRCSSCGQSRPGYDTLARRTWRHVSLWGIPVRLTYAPRRVVCPTCGIKVEAMPWSRGKSDLSLPLIVVLAAFARMLSLSEVARLFNVRWNTVRTAVKASVDHGLEHRETSEVVAIGVDEISRRKGHRYVTMVYDLVGMRLLWCSEGRETSSLEAFFEEWGEERCRAISVVCMDMWKPYRKAVERHLPHALIVHDRFHVANILLKAVDKVRVEEARRLKEEGCPVLAGTRFIFMKNYGNLSGTQRERLSEMASMNLRVNRAYLLKEDFSRFWDCPDMESAQRFLDDWFWRASHSRIEQMVKAAYQLREHSAEILNYHRIPVTNAGVEGMNRKAKVLAARAYGFRTVGTFRLMLYHVLGKLPQLETTHRFL